MLEVHTIFDDNSTDAKAPVEYCVTDIEEAVRDRNRVNIYINNKYYCSLDISQVVDLHIKIGKKLDNDALADLKRASEFGKFYARALEYVLMRPHSSKEVRDYLKRKTMSRRVRIKNSKTGEYSTCDKAGYDVSLVPLVYERLEQRGYIDDRRFARAWIENRNISRGSSIKKLRLELCQKGVSAQIIDEALSTTSRSERDELRKIIARKANKYSDRQKLVQYLVRQGFNYSDVVDELSVESSSV